MDQQLTIGELFPADDVIAQWVFSVSAVVDDLQLVQREQKAGMAISDGRDIQKMLFLQRILTVRLYEARRLVYVANHRPEIAEFIGEKNSFFEKLRQYYEPRGSSLVDELYAVVRNQSVHYMWPGSDELASVLRAAARLPAKMKLSTTPPRIDVEWAQGVAGLSVFGEFSETGWLPRVQQRGQLSAAIQRSWTMLFGVVIFVYARRKGIPADRFSAAPDDSTPDE